MEPLPVHLHDKVTAKGRSKPHIIYRRSITLDNKREIHVARERREIHTCGTEGKRGLDYSSCTVQDPWDFAVYPYMWVIVKA